MLQFIVGFVFGAYVGTYYDCKPSLDHMKKIFKDYLPPPKSPLPKSPLPKSSESDNNFDFFPFDRFRRRDR